MPMTIITLSNAPPSLRGDLTKWMQEIATGVYIGNFSSRVREKLWERVKESIGNGHATLSYSSRNELGYSFETHQTNRQPLDLDGVQLVLYPKEIAESNPNAARGFSDASMFRKVKKFRAQATPKKKSGNYVILDIETDGLDCHANNIIEIGAIKIVGSELLKISMLVKIESRLPQNIINLTGITNELLGAEGISLKEALKLVVEFVGDLPIIGYAINFDKRFLDFSLKRCGMEPLRNKTYDLMSAVKKENMYLKNYRLETVLKYYNLNHSVDHRALSDARKTYELAMKVNGFLDSIG